MSWCCIARHSDDRPLHKHLSDREYQVLCLIASGKEVKEISGRIGAKRQNDQHLPNAVVGKDEHEDEC